MSLTLSLFPHLKNGGYNAPSALTLSSALYFGGLYPKYVCMCKYGKNLTIKDVHHNTFCNSEQEEENYIAQIREKQEET